MTLSTSPDLQTSKDQRLPALESTESPRMDLRAAPTTAQTEPGWPYPASPNTVHPADSSPRPSPPRASRRHGTFARVFAQLAATTLASGPIQAAKHACSPATWRLLRTVARRHGVSTHRVATRSFHLILTAGFTPKDAGVRGLLDPTAPLDRDHFQCCNPSIHKLQKRLNPSGDAVCRDKVLFHSHCRLNQLPCPRLSAVITPPLGWTVRENRNLHNRQQWEEFFRDDAPETFVIKPARGSKGVGVRCFRREDDHLLELGPESRRITVAQAYDSLCEETSPGRWIVEEKLAPHPDLQRLTGSQSISTIRLITLIQPDGAPVLTDAHFRIVVGNAVTDNISNGRTGRLTANLHSILDLKTGTITRAWAMISDQSGRDPVQRHPLTHEPIIDFQIPFWEEACELVRTAALRFLPLRTIGWDVAITPTGPVLIEGNETYQYYGVGPKAFAHVEALRHALRTPFRPS